MDFEWKPEYEVLARQFLKLHFGDSSGLTHLFPCMREEYRWSSKRPAVSDSRIPAKNNTEYHGLERHAWQYYATAQYEHAYHYWLLAAWWRREDSKANGFDDPRHRKAIAYCIAQALYNQALHEWQRSRASSIPIPEQFGLRRSDIEGKEDQASTAIENYANSRSRS